MTNQLELAKKQKAIMIRGGIELWLDEEKADLISEILIKSNERFIKIKELNTLINAADVVGIFDPQTMDERTKRQNGEWQCRQGNWHERKEKCECVDKNHIKAKCAEADAYYDQYGAWPLWYKAEWRKQIV